MSNLDWATLIRERDEWVARNFPPYEGEIPGNDSILGCIEELGELCHAHLKLKQGIRGTPAEHNAAAQDAIGDIVVYLMGVMSAHINRDQVAVIATGRKPITPEETLFLLANEVGFLAATTIGSMTGSWVIAINNILKYCESYCTFKGWDFDAIVMTTWNHVKLRDWNAHRGAGAAMDDPAVKDPQIPPMGADAWK